MTTIKKCDWGQKNKKNQNLIGFLSANIINNCNSGGEKEKKEKEKEKKIQKNLQSKSNNKNNKCFSWVTAVRVLFFAGSHSPPYLPRMPSNTVLFSGPWCWVSSDSNLVLLLCVLASNVQLSSTPAIRNSVFSFVGALNSLLYIP